MLKSADESELLQNILLAEPGQSVELPPKWTIYDLVRWTDRMKSEGLWAAVAQLPFREATLH